MKKLICFLIAAVVLTTAIHAQDTTRQRMQQQAPIQKRDRIHQQDHYMYLDGKMYRVQNGVRTEMKEKMQLQNCLINPDGSYQLKNQQMMQLRNGECLDPNGNRYASQQKFNRNKMMNQQQVNRAQQQVNRGQRMNQQQRTNPPRTNTSGRMNGRRN